MSRRYAMRWSVLALTLLLPVASWAANPHFTACPTSTADGVLTLTGQVAGLGNQVKTGTALTFTASATALCVDSTTEPPTVLASLPLATSVTYPPKNGNRIYALTLDGSSLLCAAPAELVFTEIEVCNVPHGICCPPLDEEEE